MEVNNDRINTFSNGDSYTCDGLFLFHRATHMEHINFLPYNLISKDRIYKFYLFISILYVQWSKIKQYHYKENEML